MDECLEWSVWTTQLEKLVLIDLLTRLELPAPWSWRWCGAGGLVGVRTCSQPR